MFETHVVGEAPDAAEEWLGRCEALHRTLRPDLPGDYAALMRAMFTESAEMAVRHKGGEPVALAVFRRQTTTFHGPRLYVDDLVAAEGRRGEGHGAALLRWCEARARALGCRTLALDSGVQRAAAHRFYFRERFAIGSFGFAKPL